MDFFILVTGTDAGEREDYMTEKIREYSMNGALISVWIMATEI